MNWAQRLETIGISQTDWLIYADWEEEYGDIDIANGIRKLNEEGCQPRKTPMSIELELLLTSRAIEEDISFEKAWEWKVTYHGTFYRYTIPNCVAEIIQLIHKDDDDMHIKINEYSRKIESIEFFSRFKAIQCVAKTFGSINQ